MNQVAALRDVNRDFAMWIKMLIFAPGAITKQKPDKEKKVKNQNAQRAKKLGIEYIPKL